VSLVVLQSNLPVLGIAVKTPTGLTAMAPTPFSPNSDDMSLKFKLIF
jgi:hypothetical protein